MCMSYEVKVWKTGIIQPQAFRLDRALGKFKRMIRGLKARYSSAQAIRPGY